jgi:ABC-type multidrug transport system ATPase subunit
VRELIAAGVTILLTAQYLEEADALADNIVLIDTVARWLLGRRRS